MSLKKKYLEYKKKVELVENIRSKVRNSKTWQEIRELKKHKLALKDAIEINSNSKYD